MSTGKAPIKHSLLSKIGHIYVESNQLGIVFRDGRFGRFLEPGWHPSLIPWEERLVAHFLLEWRSVKLTAQVPARDGYHFTTAVDIQYYFDPSQANRSSQAEMVSVALSHEMDYKLRTIIKRAALYSLRNEVNQYDSEELRCGAVSDQIERRIRQHLHRTLTPLGISTNKPESVFIETLTAPAELVRAAESDYRHRKIAQLLVDYTQVGQVALWLDTLAQQNDVVYHTQGPFGEQTDSPMIQSVPIKPGHNGDGNHTTELYHLRNTAC